MADEALDSLLLYDCPYFSSYSQHVRNNENFSSLDGELLRIKNILNYTSNEYFDWWMTQDEILSRRFLDMKLPNGISLDDEKLIN